MSGNADQKRIEMVLEIVGLRERAPESGAGLLTRNAAAARYCPGAFPTPDFVILDEPTDGLDPQGCVKFAP
jgi:ABC-type transporter Mla maintaining outer membrane lipid asymmetry ATPase subunit MlaF